MESTLTLVQEHAARCQATRVNNIVLRIGTLAGVEFDALRFAFEIVVRGTIAEGASLTINRVEALAVCPECHRTFTPDHGAIFTCPDCGALCGELRQGRELELSRIEFH